MQTRESSFMHTPDSIELEEQIRNRDVEFQNKAREDVEAPAIGILAVTALFVFLVVMFNIFSPTNQPPANVATPGVETNIETKPFPAPMPMPNSGAMPAPTAQP